MPGSVPAYLGRHGRPITYSYVPGDWPLRDFQTVFARDPGSAEMPSAGRPFTDGLVTDLLTAGVAVAPVTLHTGVSSLEVGEPPLPEPFAVPAATARLVEHTRRHGGRVVAVGTTVTRALETVAGPDGSVSAGTGWTDLVLGPDRPARVVDRPGHRLARARGVTPAPARGGRGCRAGRLRRTTRRGPAGYLWHELGDSALLLP